LHHPLLLFQLQILLPRDVCKAPFLRDNDLLTTGELVTGTPKSLHDDSLVLVFATYGKENLANVYAGDGAVGLAPRATHTSLQTIGTSARQHLVDTDNVERVDADTHVEGIFTRDLGDILVGANTGGLKRLGGDLFVLVGYKMAAEREFVDVGPLTAQIEDADLRVGYTTVVPRLGVWLVLAVAVAASRSAAHLESSL